MTVKEPIEARNNNRRIAIAAHRSLVQQGKYAAAGTILWALTRRLKLVLGFDDAAWNAGEAIEAAGGKIAVNGVSGLAHYDLRRG